MVPDRRPGPAQIAFSRGPRIGGVEIEADDRIRKPELGILLDQVGHLIAGEVGTDNVGLGLPDLQQIRAEVGDIGGNEFITDQFAAVALKKFLRRQQGRGRKGSRQSA